MNDRSRNLTALAGRILLAAVFVLSGFNKLSNFSGTAGFMAGAGLPIAEVLLVLTILIEIIGGLMLVTGYRTRLAALILFLFMIPVTLVFHNPATATDAAMAQQQTIQLLKNLAIMGGILQLWAFGPGAISLDTRKDVQEFAM